MNILKMNINLMDLLPNDLVEYINYYNSINTIINAWIRYKAKIYIAIILLQKLNSEPYINVMSPHTCAILEYSIKYAPKNQLVIINDANSLLYNEILLKILQSLYEDQYTGGPGAKYYNKIEQIVNKYLILLDMPEDVMENIHLFII